MKRNILFLIVYLLTIYSISNAQENPIKYPKIGDTIDYTFNEVINYKKSNLKISDFHGEWVVLDFWSKYCSTCIASFPKMEKLGKAFKGKVNLIMAGLYLGKKTENLDDGYYTRRLFNMQSQKYNLTFINAFELKKNTDPTFDIYAMPVILVINPEGIIVAKSQSLDSLQLTAFISGKIPPYNYAYSHSETDPAANFNFNLPLLTNGEISNGGIIDTSYLYRSLLCKWTPSMPDGVAEGFQQSDSIRDGHIFAYGWHLSKLLMIAYTGKPTLLLTDSLYQSFSQKVILELPDSSKLLPVISFDPANTYSYSLKMPSGYGNYQTSRKELLHDLERLLGIQSSLETRKVSVYKLITIDTRKATALKTKGIPPNYTPIGVREGFKITNWPMEKIMTNFLPALYNDEKSIDNDIPVIINQSGIKGNIDLTILADTYEINSINKSLYKSGLKIIKEMTSMICIVVRNKANDKK